MEFVYVVPRRELFPDCYPQGLVRFPDARTRGDFEARVRDHGFFVERDYAERTPTLKQVIPYTVITCQERILLLRRLSTGGERRLHDKLSIGVGGHINPEDLTTKGADPLREGSRREIEEELDVRGAYETRAIGLLNDDSNPVGAVHVGLVQLATVRGTVEIREKDQLEGRMVPPGEIRDLHLRGENFETWSSILIENFVELLPNREPVAT
jgi:predicted NUDIX family phosphoesterase